MNYDDLGLGVGSLIKILPITTDQGYIPHISVLRPAIRYYFCLNAKNKTVALAVSELFTTV